MSHFQNYNKRKKAYVKYYFNSKGVKIINVKKRLPHKPFKGVPITRKKKYGKM